MTKIEWVQNPDGTQGKTWNPITGCDKISTGCKNCFAERMARRLAGRYGYPKAPNHFDVTLHYDRRDEPVRRRKPTTYFVCSMGDLFHEDIEWADIAEIWEVMAWAEQHTFQVLTKRPQRMLEFLLDYWMQSEHHSGVVLPNVWLGITAENQATADERIPLLLQTPAAVRFVSCEPLLGAIDVEKYLQQWQCPDCFTWQHTSTFCDSCGTEQWENIDNANKRGLDWVIVGGETGPGARPMHPQWARDIRDQCQAAGVPFFFKSWGAWVPGANDRTGQLRNHGHFCADGQWINLSHQKSTAVFMSRVTKKRSGHLLDGREWREFPTR